MFERKTKKEKQEEERLKRLKAKAKKEEKKAAYNERILRAREVQKSQKPRMRRSFKGQTPQLKTSLVTVNVQRVKKQKSKKGKKVGVYPRKKPQSTNLYKWLTGE